LHAVSIHLFERAVDTNIHTDTRVRAHTHAHSLSLSYTHTHTHTHTQGAPQTMWLKFDDEKVSLHPEEEVKRTAGGADGPIAYVCLYGENTLSL